MKNILVENVSTDCVDIWQTWKVSLLCCSDWEPGMSKQMKTRLMDWLPLCGLTDLTVFVYRKISPISSVLGLVMTKVPLPGCSSILLLYTCQLKGFPFFSQRYLKYLMWMKVCFLGGCREVLLGDNLTLIEFYHFNLARLVDINLLRGPDWHQEFSSRII